MQWTMITVSVVYGVLFMDVDERIMSPFQSVSKKRHESPCGTR